LAYTILELIAAGRDQSFVVQQLIGLCIALALPSLSMLSPGRLKWAGTAPMQTVGRASYGYYLLHQNLGISLLTATKLKGLLSVAAMFGIEAVILCAALLLFHLIEKPVSVFAHNRVKWTNRQTGKVTELGR
jgi:peptidoglycan/LPS O-acetylase OafA/YrhL